MTHTDLNGSEPGLPGVWESHCHWAIPAPANTKTIQTGSSPVLQFLELRNCRSLGEQPHDMRVDGFSTQTPRCNNNNKLVPSLSKKSITHYHQYQFHHLLLIFFIFYNPIIRTDSYLNTDFSNQILNYFLPCYLLSASGFNPLHFIFNISFHPIIHIFVWSMILQSQPCSTTIYLLSQFHTTQLILQFHNKYLYNNHSTSVQLALTFITGLYELL